MSTIFIGDLHLKSGIILPMIDDVMTSKQITNIVMTGDYLDQWSQQHNTPLYLRELDFIYQWKLQKEQSGITVTCLLGNHDVPYLTGHPAHYSLTDSAGREQVRELLLRLKPRIACEREGYLVSHGGYLGETALEAWHLEVLTAENLYGDRDLRSALQSLGAQVGTCRGGVAEYGGPLWADALCEFPHYPSALYPKQIVGHRPVKEITTLHQDAATMIAIDTFTVIRAPFWPHYYPRATSPGVLWVAGDVVEAQVIAQWARDDTGCHLIQYFENGEQ